MSLSLIVALARNRVIGRAGRLPWRLPEDLKFFRRMTVGKPVLMGRRTFESIGRPLPERQNIVLSRDPAYRADGCQVVQSLGAALAVAGPAAEVMVIGGATLYARTLPRAERLYLTLVQAKVAGDVYFPAFDWSAWREDWREEHSADERHAYPYTFLRLERRRGSDPV
jgi:dihydrofolate reductase